MRSIVTLTTDFGPGSHYVAQMKGVLLSRDSGLQIVDVTHSVPAQDVVHAAFIVGQLPEYFPARTIHIVVVDPGVGTDRQIICGQWRDQLFVGPDNGVFSMLDARFAAESIYVVEHASYWRQPTSRTFHGRDIMAPVATELAQGLSPAQLGRPLAQLTVRHELPLPQIGASGVRGEIVFIDSFGNLITNIQRTHCAGNVAGIRVHAEPPLLLPIVPNYADRAAGEAVALFGSSGHLEIAIVNGDAARRLRLPIGTRVAVMD